MSQITLTAKEIADLKGVGEKAVRKAAAKGQWTFEKAKTRGMGQNLYYLSDLPTEIQLLYNKERLAKEAENLPAIIQAKHELSRSTSAKQVPASLSKGKQKEALFKADLLRLYTQRIESALYGQKTQARDSFINAYNSGLLYPDLFNHLGQVSWRTIEGWKRDFKAAGRDCFVLADQRGAWRRGVTSIGPEHAKVLLSCLLNPHAVKLAEGIRIAREVMRRMGIPNGFSNATYLRWINNWRERNFHIWTFTRHGWKAWNDTCALSGRRDYDLIEVGDVVVADGHVLNFDIINPWTGKPKRMTLLLWIDMKSSYPLGWEIMPTENTQAISAALRWAIIRLGKIPKIAYLDNGKAFGSRFFSGKDLDQFGFTGLYDRLGMEVMHARPYRGQSKPIERFFESFAELERWTPTFTGTSIDTKPPGMMRGEKLHSAIRQQDAGGGITLEMAHAAVAGWFDEYVNRPQQDGHLKDITPAEVFLAGRGPGVDREMLNDMMMDMQVKSLQRSEIKLLGRQYYHPDFHGRKHQVVIRYDFQDPSYIRVHEMTGELICVATEYGKLHPAAGYLGTATDEERLAEHCAEHRRQEREASSVAKTFLLDEFLPAHRKQMAQIGVETLQLPEAPKSGKAEARKAWKPLPPKQIEAPEISNEEFQRIQDEASQVEVYQDGESEAELRAWREAQDRTLASAREEEETAQALRVRLEGLDEPERYLAIKEMELRGILLPSQQQDFLRYFTHTLEYMHNADKFETEVAMMAVQWQAESGARSMVYGSRE